MRDVTLEDTVYIAFTTRAFATGIPTVLIGTPVISAYEDAGLTQITAGITLGVDHDSVVGLNMITLVATAANGFEDNKDYNLVITTGTVGGVSVVGEVVGQFSIQRAPVNWANVSNPTTANDLSGTDIQLVDTITTYTGNTLQTGDNYARLGAPAGASVSADIAAAKVDTATILVDTAVIGAAGAGLTDLGGMSTAMKAEVAAEAVKNLTTQLTESYSTDGTAPTLTQAIMAIQQMLQEASVSSTTMTVKKLDGSTSAMTFTLNDATSPTSITRAT